MNESYRFCTSKLMRWDSIDIQSVDSLAVLVLCGSFNPIHQTHIDMFDAACDALACASPKTEIVGGFISLVNDGYDKNNLRPFVQRAEVCHAALRSHRKLVVDEWEGRQPTYVRTFYVLQHIQQASQQWYEVDASPNELQRDWIRRNPVRVVFVCGGDLFVSFMQPGCWSLALLKRLLDLFDVLVVRRAGGCGCAAMMQEYGAKVEDSDAHGGVQSLDLSTYNFFETDCLSTTVSSTMIRHLLAGNPSADLAGLIPDEAQSLVRLYFAGG